MNEELRNLLEYCEDENAKIVNLNMDEGEATITLSDHEDFKVKIYLLEDGGWFEVY